LKKIGSPSIRNYIAKEKHKYRLLEFWGTPYEQTKDVEDLHVKQYYTPYNNIYNYFLGFVIQSPPEYVLPAWKRYREKRPPGKYSFLLWGKLLRYFDDRAWKLVQSIQKKYPELYAVATISDADSAKLPSYITNHGIIDSNAWKKLLAESVFIIGFGDPVMGPTVLEAIAAGCVYLNPKYSTPKILHMNRRMPLDSQHPQARDLYGGEPYVYDINLDDVQDVLNAVGRVLQNHDSGLIRPYVPYDYTLEAVTDRVARDLDNEQMFIL
jgi:hypothetical protein